MTTESRMPAHRSRRVATAALATAGAATLALTLVPTTAQAHQPAARAATSASAHVKAGDDGGSRALAVGDDALRPASAREDRQQDRKRDKGQAASERDLHPSTTRAGEGSDPDAQESPRKRDADHYADNLDGWIREALAIMDDRGIPGTYDGLYRNIMRESSGDPDAINLWDVNARNGTPSIGLLQVIKPTFDAYHVSGTSFDIYDPVANICAAANYAADRYGTIDNVDSAY